MGIISLIVLFGLAAAVSAIDYEVTWDPPRVAYDTNVTVTFQLKRYSKPLSSVSLRFFYEFFIAENNQCRSVLTSGATVVIKQCDFENAKFEVELQGYKETKTFTIHAYGQEPPYEKFIIPVYKAPSGLILDVPKNVQSGMIANLRCEFDLGQNNLANFSWYRINATRAIPYGRIGELILKNRKRQDLYGHVSYFEFTARPGDEGYYRCSAKYNPSSVGEFTSEPAYLDVRYAPQIDMNREYFTEYEAKLGEKVLLKWSLLSNPRPSHVFWSRNGVLLKNNAKYRLSTRETDFGVTLTLAFKATRDNFGTFFCFVNNSMGSTQIYFHVRDIYEARTARPSCNIATPKIVTSDSSLSCGDLEFDRNLWRIVALALMAFILFALAYGAIWCTVSRRCKKKNDKDRVQSIKMKRVI